MPSLRTQPHHKRRDNSNNNNNNNKLLTSNITTHKVSKQRYIVGDDILHKPGVSATTFPVYIVYTDVRQTVKASKDTARDWSESVVTDVDITKLRVVREHISTDSVQIRSLEYIYLIYHTMICFHCDTC